MSRPRPWNPISRKSVRTPANCASRGPLGFFFQAEDGIRDKLVTGVQTCALPISFLDVVALTGADASPSSSQHLPSAGAFASGTRSEERRVGKECRSRRSPYH